MEEKVNLSNILLKNNHVNNYTKLLIILSRLHYYEDYYIPNSKLMKMLKIHKKNVIFLLNQLKEDNIIAIFYKGKKRFFTFIENGKEKQEEKEIIRRTNDVFDYDWLNNEED